MKNVLILHGTENVPTDNWFPWLQSQLESQGYKVWVPALPQADRPNIKRYNKFLLDENDWKFNEKSIIVGHSSGAVATLGLLEALPDNVKVGACYLVSSFKDNLGWDALDGLFETPFNFEKIKNKSKAFYFIHADNDPYCPVEHAQFLRNQIGGDLIILPGQKHFSVSSYGEKYRQFPYLLHLILGDATDTAFVTQFYQDLKQMGITIWLDGGWAVDAVLEEQTRPHSDVDITIQKRDLVVARKYLQDKGFREIIRGDTTAWNFVLGDDQGHWVDFHVIELDQNGDGIYGPEENGDIYPKASLEGKGKIDGVEVNCISPEWLVKFHTGYDLRPIDYHDVSKLCQKFHIRIPEAYEKKR